MAEKIAYFSKQWICLLIPELDLNLKKKYFFCHEDMFNFVEYLSVSI